jgi:glycosyltransferase involved in cell wall biosynthesis
MSKLWQAIQLLREADILYISTVVVLNFMVAARFHSNAIVHVHEIPNSMARPFFRGLVRFSRAKVVFNSRASFEAYGLRGRHSAIVYNGYRPREAPSFSDFDGVRPLRILMIGRISLAKGQDLLIKAIAALPPRVPDRLRVRIVGSTFEDDAFREKISRSISKLKLSGGITLDPFDPDPVDIYKWCDVLIVPSRAIESFGLVVIEAMAYGKSVIAVSQGGIREIVVDGQTGWLFPAGDVDRLAASIMEALNSPEDVVKRGRAGYLRFLEHFHMSRASRELESIAVVAGVKARAQGSG